VREEHLDGTFKVRINGREVGKSDDVVRVDEDGHPNRFYFPRASIDMSQLERTNKTTECPFKGTASYYSLRSSGSKVENIAWSYESPYDEHVELAGRIAFYDDSEGVAIEA
jgi:uncharacterized protein (DUF427 family)